MKCPNYYLQQTDFPPQAGMLDLLALGQEVSLYKIYICSKCKFK